MAPGVASRAAPAAVMLSRAECDRLGLRDGGRARVAVDGDEPVELRVVVKDMPPGVASVTAGLSSAAVITLPAWAALSAAAEPAEARR